jgi:2-oxoisovalerate dehydrogenase E1 component
MAQVIETVTRSPSPDPASARDHVYSPATSRLLLPSVSSEAQGDAQPLTYIRAVNEALRRELKSRPNVLLYGEDVGHAGGIFGAARQLQKEFGAERVFDTPISESAILGSAVGAAMSGMKPIVEIMWADFMLVALDQLVNQAANVRYITSGKASAPIVVRTQQGVTPGSCAQHSQSLEALLLHIPGLRVAVPATPQDAYSMIRAAVASEDPCIVVESRALYQTSAPVVLSDTIEPVGSARLCRNGAGAAIVTWGSMVRVALDAAEMLAKEGIQAAVLDLRWLSPLDEQAMIDVTRAAGGRAVVLHEANLTGGFGAEIASRLYERLDGKVHAKIRRVGTPDMRMPSAPALQRELVPNAQKVAEAVRSLVAES